MSLKRPVIRRQLNGKLHLRFFLGDCAISVIVKTYKFHFNSNSLAIKHLNNVVKEKVFEFWNTLMIPLLFCSAVR